MKDVIISNCVLDNTEAVIRLNSSSFNKEFNASITGCTFKNISDPLIAVHGSDRVVDWAMPFTKPDMPGYIDDNETSTNDVAIISREDVPMRVNCHLAGNSYSNATFRNIVLDGAKLRIINTDLPFETLENLSPKKGDMCRHIDGLFIYTSNGWINLAEDGSKAVIRVCPLQ